MMVGSADTTAGNGLNGLKNWSGRRDSNPRHRDRFLWDTEIPGFGLKITKGGARVYVLQYRVSGRLQRYTIGRHGAPWTPEQARQEVRRLLGSVARGEDPAQAKADTKRDISVVELCELYFSEGCTTKKQTTVAGDRGRVEDHIEPLLGRRSVSSLTRGDVERLLQDVASGKAARDERTGVRGRRIVRGGTGVANRVIETLGAILSFAVRRGLRDDNPVRGVTKFKLRRLERFLSGEEMQRLGRTLDAMETRGNNLIPLDAIRLLALTGCRKSEILGLRWDHIDFERKCLRLPASKTGAKIVPLGDAAVAILARRVRIRDNPFAFPGGRDGKPFIGLSKVWRTVKHAAGLDDVRLHDLRHNFASLGVNSGQSLPVIGAILGHASPRTTSRYAHLADDPVRNAVNHITEHINNALTRG